VQERIVWSSQSTALQSLTALLTADSPGEHIRLNLTDQDSSTIRIVTQTTSSVATKPTGVGSVYPALAQYIARGPDDESLVFRESSYLKHATY
jgi:hypothetical protein